MSFAKATVLAFESRRAKEMSELIRINGGEPLVAPALIEVPLEQNEAAFRFADRLYAGDFDMVVFLTGVGTRYLQRVLSTREPESRFAEALRGVAVVARGPKPTAVLREWQVPIAVSVPEPNTWRELLEAVRNRGEKSVAVQEYGRSNPELLEGLRAQGRSVTAVPVYQWQLPEDTKPLAEALTRLLDGGVNAALFTTGVQIEHFLDFAAQCGRREQAIRALEHIFLGSIGPDTTEALEACGLVPVLEPSHPKMGLLVREAAARYAETHTERAS
ncbi:MAG: uroporphyrinogen-III synthase [Acidobacteriaceae bacterium]|nr:uroporphyrinogen-III synthase [Acidobacteriaceae bacterium]